MTSATSGARLTSPVPETVTVCSGAPVVSAASVGWPLMIGPTMMPRSRHAAAVTAIARPKVTGPARREAARPPVAGSWSNLAFEGWSFIVNSCCHVGSAVALRLDSPTPRWGVVPRAGSGARTPGRGAGFRAAAGTIATCDPSRDNPWRRVSRRVAYENPWLELLPRRRHPAGRPAGHLRRRPFPPPGDRRRADGRAGPRAARRPVPLHAGPLLLGDPRGRRQLRRVARGRRPGASWPRRPATSAASGASSAAPSCPTPSRTRSRSSSSPRTSSPARPRPRARSRSQMRWVALRRGHGDDRPRRDPRRDDDPPDAAARPGAGGRAQARARSVTRSTFEFWPRRRRPMYHPLACRLHSVYALDRRCRLPRQGRPYSGGAPWSVPRRRARRDESPRAEAPALETRRVRPQGSARRASTRALARSKPAMTRPRSSTSATPPAPSARTAARRQPPRADLGGRAGRTLERLALADVQPRQHARGDRARPEPDRRRARRPVGAGQVPRRHHALLPEPDRPRRPERPDPPPGHPHRLRARSLHGDDGGLAGRGPPLPGSGAGPPLPGPRPDAGHHAVRELLPLLHAVADRRRRDARTSTAPSTRPSSTTCAARRRSATCSSPAATR